MGVLVVLLGSAARAVNGSVRAEMLTGAAARAHVERKEQHSAKFREARREARQELRAMGFTSTGGLAVVRFVADPEPGVWARLASLVIAPLWAQAYGDGSGEIVFDTWDDGDHSTWEGHVYVEDYQTGRWSSFNTQFEHYVSTQNGDIPRATWIGRTVVEREVQREASTRGGGAVLARLRDAIVPGLCAQTSDNLACGADPREQVERFMEAGFRRVRDNSWTILAGASLAGFVSGPHAFIGVAGFQVWGHMLQGYVNEFSRYYSRCR